MDLKEESSSRYDPEIEAKCFEYGSSYTTLSHDVDMHHFHLFVSDNINTIEE